MRTVICSAVVDGAEYLVSKERGYPVRRIEDFFRLGGWIANCLQSARPEPFVEDAGEVPAVMLLSDKNGARMMALCCPSPSEKEGWKT